ncbi:MAG: hypothetical protein TR69_WS6001000369 [candidate division WS6 bacterium OLB20]|uniref:Uncharacterized protein n=1 Tax=candidate division WS6 bacterium OLB20 TaxID=1617426 RepID=A0A136LXP4_9BACT|nr:MAG: hypothetical protein TR69_WS6001000369 [candidate division WS6 bacterium OLB20]
MSSEKPKQQNIIAAHLTPGQIRNILADPSQWGNYLVKTLRVLSPQFNLSAMRRDISDFHTDSLPVRNVHLVKAANTLFGYVKTMPVGTDLRPVWSMGTRSPLADYYYEVGNVLNGNAYRTGDPDGAIINGPTSDTSTGIHNNGSGFRVDAGNWMQHVPQHPAKGAVSIFRQNDSYAISLLSPAEAGAVAAQPSPEQKALVGTAITFDHDGSEMDENQMWEQAVAICEASGFYSSYNSQFGFLAQDMSSDNGFTYYTMAFLPGELAVHHRSFRTIPALRGIDLQESHALIGVYLMLNGANGNGLHQRYAMMEMNSASKPLAASSLKNPDVLHLPMGFYAPRESLPRWSAIDQNTL